MFESESKASKQPLDATELNVMSKKEKDHFEAKKLNEIEDEDLFLLEVTQQS
jgi:hypothetical protein